MMAKKKKWTELDLEKAVLNSKSFRQVLKILNLVEAGGNYNQIKEAVKRMSLDVSHFTGRGWNKGIKISRTPIYSLKEILTKGSAFQSFKLKRRLFNEGVKEKKCEQCGWCKISSDGRIPLELDHINGDRYDNRIENIRILCPNCHSLQPTHRGLNIKRRPE